MGSWSRYIFDLPKHLSRGFLKRWNMFNAINGRKADTTLGRAKKQAILVYAPTVNPPGPECQRGWTAVGLEATSKLFKDTSAKMQLDVKEHFDHGRADDLDYHNHDLRMLNCRSFEPLWYDAKTFDNICMQLMRALESGLKLEKWSFTRRCIPSASDLRLNHYPAIKVEDLNDGSVSRISSHTNFGIISLLLQDGVGGLEIEDRRYPDPFLPIAPRHIEMIINASDTLQRWTSDVLRNGIHQVTGPNDMEGKADAMLAGRFSTAYLFKAGREDSVAPLLKYADLQYPQEYYNMTALGFQRWRNAKIYAS